MVELLNIDCMGYMRTLPDKSFDLAIVDPPYGIGEDGRNNHTRTKLARAKDYRGHSRYDNAVPDSEYFKELRRVSKNQIIWGGNYFIHELDATPCFIVWDKDNGDNDFADCELAWTSFPTAVRKFKHTWNGMLQEDMKNKEERIHPNHKPIRLYRWLLTTYAKDGDKILDTHLGSGSSAIAAHQMGFDFVGCEIDKYYYDAACKRFKEQTMQQDLFKDAI
jgi:site-specific DNA-methyltransferase (adenine-specific)